MKYFLFPFILLFVFSCSESKKNDETIDFTAQNEQEILTYITDNNLTAQKSATGLHYVINTPGTGAQPNANSDVTVSYKGTFIDGKVFDQSDANGISFNLQGVIAGWTEGITYFKEGGSGILLVPSSLGYGSRDNRGIPGGSVLIFEVTLIAVN